jgi:hypothetical protein
VTVIKDSIPNGPGKWGWSCRPCGVGARNIVTRREAIAAFEAHRKAEHA